MGTAKQDVKTAIATLPRHSEVFKRDAVRLMTEEGYNFAAAAKAVGGSDHKWSIEEMGDLLPHSVRVS